MIIGDDFIDHCLSISKYYKGGVDFHKLYYETPLIDFIDIFKITLKSCKEEKKEMKRFKK